MKEISFNVGDRVMVINDCQLRKGVIKNFYPVTPPVFAVEFEDGTVEKVSYNNVAPEPKAEIATEENESVEKSEITITPKEFMELSCDIIAEETKDYKILGFMVAKIVSKIHTALFFGSAEND